MLLLRKPRERAIAVGLGCLLLFGTLFCGGNRPLPSMLLQLGALAVLLLRLWPPVFAGGTRPLVLITAALVFCYPLLYLIPLPLELWTQLPGRDRYAEALALVEAPSGWWRPMTIVPARTESAWITLLPPLAAFIAAVGLPRHLLKALIWLAVGVAVGQALLGLMQYGAGPTSPLCLGNPYCGDTATGTYANRNHLAGLLEMMFPVGLGLLAATVGQVSRLKPSLVSWRKRLLALSSSRGQLATLYGGASLAILLGLVFTRSRSGVTLAMIGMLLALFAFAGRLGGNNSLGVFGTLNAIALVLAVEIGLAPVLQRFTLQDPLEDSRWTVFASTLEGVGSFFPLGSGAGTFPDVYRQFQPAELGRFFVNHVHNDYLEWIFEGGLVSAALLLLVLVLALRQWSEVWTRGQWTTFRFTQVGAGIGLWLIVLHGFVDFNWHIHANALYTAFLAAVFFHTTDLKASEPLLPRVVPSPFIRASGVAPQHASLRRTQMTDKRVSRVAAKAIVCHVYYLLYSIS